MKIRNTYTYSALDRNTWLLRNALYKCNVKEN